MNRTPSSTAQPEDDSKMNLEEASQAIVSTVTTINRIVQKIALIEQIASRDGAAAFKAAIEASSMRGQMSQETVMLEVRHLCERSEVAALEIGNLATFSGELAERAGALLEEMMGCISRATTLLQTTKSSDPGGRHA